MNIQNLSYANQTFKSFIGWKNKSNDSLKEQELRQLYKLKSVLNELQAKHINIKLEIEKENPNFNNKKTVRIITTPLLKDMLEIRQQPGRQKALQKEYKRISPQLPLDNYIIGKAINYTNKQKRYIDYCINDPYHNSNYIIKRKKS